MNFILPIRVINTFELLIFQGLWITNGKIIKSLGSLICARISYY